MDSKHCAKHNYAHSKKINGGKISVYNKAPSDDVDSQENAIPYSGKFSYGAKFCIFHIKLQDAKI